MAQVRFGVQDGDPDLRHLLRTSTETSPPAASAPRWPDLGQGARHNPGTSPWRNDGEREAAARFGATAEDRQEARDYEPRDPSSRNAPPALKRQLLRDSRGRFFRA